jgi:hypothetical protein
MFVIEYIEEILNDNHLSDKKLSDPSNRFTDINIKINDNIPNIKPNSNGNGNTDTT